MHFFAPKYRKKFTKPQGCFDGTKGEVSPSLQLRLYPTVTPANAGATIPYPPHFPLPPLLGGHPLTPPQRAFTLFVATLRIFCLATMPSRLANGFRYAGGCSVTVFPRNHSRSYSTPLVMPDLHQTQDIFRRAFLFNKQ